MFYLLDLERTNYERRANLLEANKRGYTYKIDEAGLYTELQANEIVDGDFDKYTSKNKCRCSPKPK